MGNLTVKESGEMVNFISPNVSNITSFKVHFSPKQEGEGDPSPENVREITGWNGVEGYISNVAQPYSSTSNTLTAAIDWTEDVGTVYGGYVDLISGELVQTWKTVNSEDLTWSVVNSTRIRAYGDKDFKTPEYTSVAGELIGEQMYVVSQTTNLTNHPNGVCIMGSRYLYKYFDGTNYPQGKISYKLATPITHQLTPQQLSTLKGQNNFWSNADYIEIEYELTETFDIQKAKRKIILNQPHVESASGDLATFDTDMKGKLKECKVYFSPVQEGEEDPSPDNVRNIVGWNGVEGYSCRKNLFNMETAVEGYIDTTGKKINSPDQENMTSDFIPVIEGETYTWTHYPTRTDINYWTGYAFYSSKDMDSVIGKRTVKNTLKPIYITVPADVRYIRIGSRYLNGGEAQLEKGSIENVSYEPYQATTTSIDWTNDVGTVYGGYVDLVSGELVQTWYKLIFDGVNQKMNRDYTDNQYIRCNQVYFYPIGANGSAILCNNLPLCIQTNITTTPCFWSAKNGSKFGGIVLGTKEEYPDLAEATAQQRIDYVNDWLKENPTTVVYKLTTPITYQLTPQQLTALRGTNNIYSNTNGQTEIKYWKH